MKKQNSKYQQIVDTLKQEILNGVYPAGHRLPGQNALAARLNVSPITTKRALNDLQAAGYIERRSRSGSFITERPRIFNEVNIVIGGAVENERLWLSSYWEGIERGAAKLGISCQLMRPENPAFVDRVLNGNQAQGVVLLSFENTNIMRQLKQKNIPFVVGEIEASHADYNVYINRRRIVTSLVEAMHEAGAKKIYFLGDLKQPNHFRASEGYRAAVHTYGKYPPESFDANEDTITATLDKILTSPEPPDGIIIAGGSLPFKALPLLLKHIPQIKLGVLTENATVLQLQGVAFIGAFDSREAGELTFELLYDVASGKIKTTTVSVQPWTS
ncbi:MAG: GntR family transcriptional regulator [Victivallaceae bacterium]